MQGDPYSSIVSSMREQGAYGNGYDLEVATVNALSPLSITYNNTSISQGIRYNEAILDSTDLAVILEKESFTSDFKEYLLKHHDFRRLSVGDKVAVQRVKDTFYIIGKVV